MCWFWKKMGALNPFFLLVPPPLYFICHGSLQVWHCAGFIIHPIYHGYFINFSTFLHLTLSPCFGAFSDKVIIGIETNRTGLSWGFFHSKLFLVLKMLKTYSETKTFRIRTVMLAVCSFKKVHCSVYLGKQDAYFKVWVTFFDWKRLCFCRDQLPLGRLYHISTRSKHWSFSDIKCH